MTTLENSAVATEAPAPGVKIRWSVPLTLMACVLLAFFDKISIAALFSDPAFQQAMGIGFDPTRLGLLMSAFLISYGFSSILLSGIGDRISPFRLLVAMMLTWALLMAAMGYTRSYTVMIVLRALLGIAEGPLFSLAFAVIRHVFPSHLQARATMMWLLGTPLGAALGFPVSLFILSHWGWQGTFHVMALLTLPVVVLAWFGLRNVRLSVSGSFRVQQIARHAARRDLLKSPHFWLICAFNIVFLTYLWGINGWLPGYLINGKGLHLEHAGWMSSLPFIAMLAGEVTSAWLSDRYGHRALACALSTAGAALGLLLVLHVSTPLAIIAAMSLSTFMWGAGAPNIFALLAKATEPGVSATAGGIFNGLGNFAGALSPAIMGVIITATGNMDSGLLFLVVMAGLGCLLLLPIIKRY